MSIKSDTSGPVSRKVKLLGAVLLVMGVVLNPWTIVRIRASGDLSLGSATFILVANFLMVAVGGLLLFANSKRAFFRTVLIGTSVGAWLLASVSATELYLATRPVTSDSYDQTHIQHLNPFYFFSLPRTETELAKLNNSVVSVTAEGFRGAGPEEKGERKLAFLLGGSAAFGDGATSNETTITGFLNKHQTEYHFVNAGVPSWNSTQEFYRVAMQLLKYRPALIVVYDGFNDVSIDAGYREEGTDVPPGTPESYPDLARWVDDIRAQPDAPLVQFNSSRLYNLSFPRTRAALTSRLDPEDVWKIRSASSPAPKKVTPLEGVEIDSDSYLWNIENMSRLAASKGTRLVVMWQAVRSLHQKHSGNDQNSSEEDDPQFFEYLKRFHHRVFENKEAGVEKYDLGDVFDQVGNGVPLDEMFHDQVHLTDAGNRVVAEEIWKRVSVAKAK